jgi:nucleoid-associated protein YgaU
VLNKLERGQWAPTVGVATLLLAPAAALWAVGATPRVSLTVLTTAQTWRATAPLDAALVAVLTVTAWAVLGWLTVSVVLVGAARLQGTAGRWAGRLADRVAPVALRRLVNGALGVTLATAVVGGSSGLGAQLAWAAAPNPSAAAASGTPGTSSDNRLDWPVEAAPAAAAPTAGRQPRPDQSADRDVVVVRGDTLWDIAAHQLGTRADNAAIATEWPRWYAANRQVIGADPNLLLPGQRLIDPPVSPPTR